MTESSCPRCGAAAPRLAGEVCPCAQAGLPPQWRAAPAGSVAETITAEEALEATRRFYTALEAPGDVQP